MPLLLDRSRAKKVELQREAGGGDIGTRLVKSSILKREAVDGSEWMPNEGLQTDAHKKSRRERDRTRFARTHSSRLVVQNTSERASRAASHSVEAPGAQPRSISGSVRTTTRFSSCRSASRMRTARSECCASASKCASSAAEKINCKQSTIQNNSSDWYTGMDCKSRT